MSEKLCTLKKGKGTDNSDYWNQFGFYNFIGELPADVTISQILNTSIDDGVFSIQGNSNGNGVCVDNNTGKTITFYITGNGTGQWGYGTFSGSLPTFNTTGANRNWYQNLTLDANLKTCTVPSGKRFFVSNSDTPITCDLFFQVPL